MKDFVKDRAGKIFSTRVLLIVTAAVALVKGVEPWTMACFTLLGMTYIVSETIIKTK